MKRLMIGMIGSIFSLLAALEGKSVDSIRRLIIIAAAIVLSTPAIGQGYGGPSAEEIRDAVQDAVQDLFKTLLFKTLLETLLETAYLPQTTRANISSFCSNKR